MRRFRFVGDPESYKALGKGYPFIVGEIYTDDTVGIGCIVSVGVYSSHELSKKDWEEVFDEPKRLHKDTDLGHFAGLAMIGYLSNSNADVVRMDQEEIAEYCVNHAQALIEALDKESTKEK